MVVPSTLRFLLESTCRKFSKIFFKSSSRMPQPLSSILNTRRSISGAVSFFPATEIFTKPFCVNFRALFKMLISICLIRRSSPRYRHGTDISNSLFSISPRWEATISIILSISPTRFLTWYSVFTSSIFPASTLDRSKISLIRASRLREAALISQAYSYTLRPLLSSIMISLSPTIAFMGVRISWDIFARNALLAIFACSACTRTSLISSM